MGFSVKYVEFDGRVAKSKLDKVFPESGLTRRENVSIPGVYGFTVKSRVEYRIEGLEIVRVLCST